MTISWKNFRSCDAEFECNIFVNFSGSRVNHFTNRIRKNIQRQKELIGKNDQIKNSWRFY